MTDPSLARLGEVVLQARDHVPLWTRLLTEQALPPYRTAADFAARVPVQDKASLFEDRDLRELVRDGRLEDAVSVLTSSGSSGGPLSFGMASADEAASVVDLVDSALDLLFDAENRRTALLTALPAGVTVPSKRALALSSGTRDDIAVRYLKSLFPVFDQVVVLAEPAFASRLIERGMRQGIDWTRERVSFVLGGDYLSCGLRGAMEARLGVASAGPGLLDGRLPVMASYGLGELGLNLAFETPGTVALRRLLHERPELIEEALGVALPSAPLLLTWDPERLYIEERGGRLVVTALNPTRFQPMIRYDTGDRGGVVDARRLEEALGTQAFELLPPLPAHLLWLYGRDATLDFAGRQVGSPELSEAVTSSSALVARLTGAFEARVDGDELRVDAWLQPDIRPAAYGAAQASGTDAASTEAALQAELTRRFGPGARARVRPVGSMPASSLAAYEHKGSRLSGGLRSWTA